MTPRAYLLIYSPDIGTREEIRDYIDDLPEILNWRYDVPQGFYLVSQSNADDIANHILRFSNGNGRFLITEVVENSQGWLPRRTWHFLNEKPPAVGSAPRSRAAPEAKQSRAG